MALRPPWLFLTSTHAGSFGLDPGRECVLATRLGFVPQPCWSWSPPPQGALALRAQCGRLWASIERPVYFQGTSAAAPSPQELFWALAFRPCCCLAPPELPALRPVQNATTREVHEHFS